MRRFDAVIPQTPAPIDPSARDAGGSGWQMIVSTVAVGALLLGLAWVALSDRFAGDHTNSFLGHPMCGPTPSEFSVGYADSFEENPPDAGRTLLEGLFPEQEIVDLGGGVFGVPNPGYIGRYIGLATRDGAFYRCP